MRVAIITLLVFFSACAPALAWNDRGHMLVALLAYRQLGESQKSRIAHILKEHPQYELLAAKCPDSVAIAEWVFIRAATWPDMVRDEPFEADYHRQKWHYVNLPFVPASEAAFVDALKFDAPSPNVLFAIDECKDLLKEKYSSPLRKAISLAWLEHTVGDIHQPLHCATLLCRAYPRGDHGGNALAVRSGQSVMSLHSYWDGVLGSEKDYASLANLADSIAADPANATAEVTALSQIHKPATWAEEGLESATKWAYLMGNLPIADYQQYKQNHLPLDRIPTLNAEYRQSAEGVARARIFLGSRRLAATLNELLAQGVHQD